ncbi:hypothetical protein, partial [Zymobacter palmae]|uniref:hypothetical protein n=1 Tax=Zymobacter palmae TaxID=33074 RepID=UPI001B801812
RAFPYPHKAPTCEVAPHIIALPPKTQQFRIADASLSERAIYQAEVNRFTSRRGDGTNKNGQPEGWPFSTSAP